MMKNYKIIDALSETPMISVAVLAYNHEKYIEQTLESILMQKTEYSFIITIAEDFSTDSTRELTLKYQQKHPGKIKLLLQNKNVGAQQNNIDILSNLDGKYIATCEGDDYWTDPFKLQKQVDFLEKNPEFSMCFHNAMLHYEEGPERNKPFGNITDREYSGEEILKEWTIPTASVVFKKEKLNYLHHPDFIYGDVILFLSLAEKGKIYGMKEIMCIYRKHEGGVTAPEIFSDDMLKKFIKHHLAIKKNFGGKYKGIESESLSRSYSSLSMRYLKINKIQSIFYLFKSFKENPVIFISDIKNNLIKFKSKL